MRSIRQTTASCRQTSRSIALASYKSRSRSQVAAAKNGRNGNGISSKVDGKPALSSFDREEDDASVWRPIAKRIIKANTSTNSRDKAKDGSLWKKLLSLPGLDYIRYTYYINRKGTMDDLSLFIAANVALLTALALARAAISGDPILWDSLYSTYKLVFGEFDDDGLFPLQLYSICVATVGFLAFALVLALVEQAFLEGLEENVRVGSQVLETGHFLLLAFGRSPRDREMLLTVSRQICHAYKDIGGTTIVILTETPKLEIQAWFRTMLNDETLGSTLVFRQGNPLTQPDLHNVNAYYAASTVILGDQSRGPIEADAQSVRVAVLLDEMQPPEEGPERERAGHIICEVYNQDSVETVTYACSPRVIPVATARLNARRLVRMLRQPIAGLTTRRLWDFSSDSRVSMEEHPQLEGELFEDVMFRFPTCTPMGVINGASILLCPDRDYRLRRGDELVMLRQSGSCRIAPLPQPIPADESGWQPRMSSAAFAMIPQHEKMTATESCSGQELDMLSLEFPCFSQADTADVQFDAGMFLPGEQDMQHLDRDPEEPLHVLICGWKTRQFMCALCRELDRGRTQLPRGSHVSFFNEHPPETLEAVEDTVRLQNVTANHVHGSALLRRDVSKLEVKGVDIAMVLCDERWLDPDQDMTNGYDDITTPGDLLRLESVVLAAQLNVRMRLERASRGFVSIVAEKMAYGSQTRFEDFTQLPVGISVNFTSFSSKMLAFLAHYPKLLVPYFSIGDTADVEVFDSSWVCGVGEVASYAQLQRRCFQLQHVLVGFYELPNGSSNPLKLVVNPQGIAARTDKRIWNIGSGHVKLLALTRVPEKPDNPLIKQVQKQEMDKASQDFTMIA